MHDFQFIVRNCKVCGGKGYIFKTEVKDNHIHNTSIQCECLVKMFLHKKFSEANIPLEYYDLDFEKDFLSIHAPYNKDIKPAVTKAVKDVEGFYHSGECLYLYGNHGTGKTMAAVEILKTACMKGYSIYYDWFPSVMEMYTKKGYKADDEKREYEKRVETTDFYVLDELGKESDYNKSDVLRVLEINILKKRSNKITIIIGNLQGGLDEIGTRYSPSIKSVMQHRFHPLHFKGTDFRAQHGSRQNKFFEDGGNDGSNNTGNEK